MPQWRTLRWLFVPLGAVGIALGIDPAQSPQPGNALSAADWRPAGYGPPDYAATKRQLSGQFDLARQRVAYDPGGWLRQESLARAHMAHSRYATDYADIAAPVRDAGDMAAVGGLRGDLAFYRGHMAGAGAYYARAGAEEGDAAAAYRRANLAKARGDYDAAIQHLLRSTTGSPREPPFQHAGTALQIGSVEQARGKYAAARKWFAVADGQFPGYWLFEAHRAQAKAIAGDLSGSIALNRIAAPPY
ncbi:hypothetical protein [Tsuneonella amylolytica]|uniref:hypothetical protein n=1 Tax=Tsuneonella amylolytica TaxID=2338327 RepID=UPI0013C42EA2|nr:hypothetical protein [Tsuneonella amylolytica]